MWIDFFNEALFSMVEDLEINEDISIEFIDGVNEYDLPENYYSLVELKDEQNQLIPAYRNNGIDISGSQTYRPGYEIMQRGSKFVITFPLMKAPRTFQLRYIRYPNQLSLANEGDKPEIPTVAETALCYKAISFALMNNNQYGQSQFVDDMFMNKASIGRRANHKARW
ncbi:hypothetical protein [Ornithinibacillus xuwenensis]|uniref:Uncharacterized protein n=1 Tax=Ornithinibacillus xuwenensis TaxID=3144668 RepID=A0ABU9XCK6_9BACI